MHTKTPAIVLHALKYGDTRLIVDMFTKGNGRLSFIVPIPSTSKGRIKKQFFQPLTLLQIETDVRPLQQLQKLSDARLLSPYASIPFDSHKLAISLFLAEFLYHALRGEQQNEPLFEYVADSMMWLDSRQEHYANFHLVFLMRLSRFLGFFPNLDDYSEGDIFDMRESVFTPQVPLHRDFLNSDDASKLLKLIRMDFPTMHLYHMSHGDRRRLLEQALVYYRLHLPDFPELRSLQVLQEMYD